MKLYWLVGCVDGERQEMWFTQGEHKTAIAIAELWLEKNWRPILRDTNWKVWVSWKARAKAKKTKKIA
jgi:hypothetical protein